MKRQIAQGARSTLKKLRHFLKTNKTVRGLLYDLDNRESFSSLLMHERIIADAVRVDAYREAIRRHVKPGDTVVDLGTGTGILSLFASERQPRRIYAIDHSEFIDVARQIAEHNCVSNITFIRINSREFTPAEKVDVIIHEQLNGALFGENMIDNVMDLKRRILKPSGILLPGKFELYLEPVCMKPSYRVPYIWERPLHGLDFGFLRQSSNISKYKNIEYQCSVASPESVDFFLCRPVPLLAFDMNAWSNSPELPSVVKVSRRVIRPGQMDGMYLYFRVIFDDETSFDTSPFSPKTHWPNYFFRTESRVFRENVEFSYTLEMGEITDVQKWNLTIEQRE
jgi:protein arginine N-methyltransferase 1